MLGIVRFFLASCVVVFHLSAQVSYLGQFSVNCFYVISGFLITMILNETYKFNLATFSLNRFLRLYPTYYFFLLIGSLIIFLMPHANEFHLSWTGRFLSGDGISNALIFPWALVCEKADTHPFGLFFGSCPFISDGSRFRIVASSWSVGVELICYFVLWLFIARHWLSTMLFVVLLSCYHAFIFYTVGSQSAVYAPVVAALLPFSIGSTGFYIYKKLKPYLFFSLKMQVMILLASILVFMLNWYMFNQTQTNGWNPTHYYINNIIALLIVILLVDSKPKGKLGYFSKLLGDLSYPVFLSHYFGGYFAWLIIGFNNPSRGWEIFSLGYAISIAMGLVSVFLIDRRISQVRNKIRPVKRPS
ncbi:acyltransferase [Escherichia coli]|uniref:acyltransferase family protein n=1 Tax=Escherichia coli TaxID=562 RepID=UPI001F49FFAE|nr:acyltransferase [Escherichia coli]MCH7128154.1 acyltransferase [Escherichia coli]